MAIPRPGGPPSDSLISSPAFRTVGIWPSRPLRLEAGRQTASSLHRREDRFRLLPSTAAPLLVPAAEHSCLRRHPPSHQPSRWGLISSRILGQSTQNLTSLSARQSQEAAGIPATSAFCRAARRRVPCSPSFCRDK